ncbi:hypothetical protein JCM17960_05520 [Magnetospira thiophila]
MLKSSKLLGAFSAAVFLAGTAGCAQQGTTQSTYDRPAAAQTAAAPISADPELAGAWYQIFFDTSEINIDARGQMVVKNVAFVAMNNEMTRVTVIGKTDRVGDAPSNMALSKQRADQVRDALIVAGVPADHIDTRWTGETRQIVSTSDDKDEQRNRVVDITVIKMMPRRM